LAVDLGDLDQAVDLGGDETYAKNNQVIARNLIVFEQLMPLKIWQNSTTIIAI